MERAEYTEANRVAWNEAASVHKEQRFEALKNKFQSPGYNHLDSTATEILQSLSLFDKSVAHLCCNNGRELISIKNLGAGPCVGFDIASKFLDQARELDDIAKTHCEFLQSDLYDIPAQYNQTFDIVLFTIGALCWLPDIQSCFAKVGTLLKPGGYLFIYEMHPALDMFENMPAEDRFKIQNSYFKSDPWIESDGLDYYSGKTYEGSTQYCFHHKLSDIFMSIIDNGFDIKSFREYDYDISNLFQHFDHADVKPPLCYTLVAQRDS